MQHSATDQIFFAVNNFKQAVSISPDVCLYRKTYQYHFITLDIHTNDSCVLENLDNFLDPKNISITQSSIQIRFYLNRELKAHLPYRYQFLCQGWEGSETLYRSSMGSRLADVSVDPENKIVHATIFDGENLPWDQIIGYVFLNPLRLILALHNWFHLHASVVSQNGRGIIISGPSGVGKSTLALTLAMNGFHLFTDDVCFFQWASPEIKLLGFPKRVLLKTSVLERFKSLNGHYSGKLFHDGKVGLPFHLFSGNKPVDSLKSEVIIFPEYQEGGPLTLKEMSADEAAGKLMKESGFGYFNPTLRKLAVDHFSAVRGLVRQTKIFRLLYHDGELNQFPVLIKSLL